ncbi:MAG: response regulator, partial [Candidatus Zixiibacteriota bacterium]
MPKILLVDDENKFRESLAKRLSMRGYETVDVDNGESAIKLIRADNDIDVVLLDRKMPGMNGEQVLNEIKSFRPELQVIMLTAFGSLQSAMEVGKMEAYSYMEKPTDFEKIVETIESAREDKVHVMARHEVPQVEKGSLWKWLVGTHNSRPGVIMLGVILFCILIYMPAPQRMLELLSAPKTGQVTDVNLGFANYRQMKDGETIAEYYSTHYKVGKSVTNEQGKKIIEALTPDEASVKARVMLGVLLVAALFWATGAVPVGVTALMTGVIMYFFVILKPDDVAQSFAKDSVIFIFGVLAVS